MDGTAAPLQGVPSQLTFTPRLRRQLADWLQEDLGRGDLSAAALQGRRGEAHWVAKAAGVFCGGLLLEPLLRELEPQTEAWQLRRLMADGAAVTPGDRLLELEGPAGLLVALERTALNLAMRLSGIATATASLVRELEGSGVALASSGARIGLDLEAVEARSEAFSRTWFTPHEQAATAGDAWAQTAVWCVKEAVLKVLGVGMAVSPLQVEVTLVGRRRATVALQGAAARVAPQHGAGHPTVQLRRLDGLVLAVAMMPTQAPAAWARRSA